MNNIRNIINWAEKDLCDQMLFTVDFKTRKESLTIIDTVTDETTDITKGDIWWYITEVLRDG